MSKVTEADIYEQIQILNDGFAGRFEGRSERIFDKVKAGDSKIRFCMGMPQGGEEGIYTVSKAGAFTLQDLALISDKKLGLEGAKKDEFINIWITELPDEMGGYAIMPDHDEARDGIYIDPDYFGKKKESKYYHSGKTLVHLMGKYLGLQQLWTNGECLDDGIEDTPIHNAPNNSCYEGQHISLCSGYPQEMVGNFMDSNPDDCAYMFTKGQVARMQACLGDLGYRKGLLNGAKLCDKKINEQLVEGRSAVKPLDFTLVPNPGQDLVEIQFENPEALSEINVTVYSMTGVEVYKHQIPALGTNKGSLQLDISDWALGQYLVTLKTGKNIKTKTLVAVK